MRTQFQEAKGVGNHQAAHWVFANYDQYQECLNQVSKIAAEHDLTTNTFYSESDFERCADVRNKCKQLFVPSDEILILKRELNMRALYD